MNYPPAYIIDMGYKFERTKSSKTAKTYRDWLAQATAKDPANRLLARGPRFRLPAFVLRDQALAASGLLVARQGGPPVKPYSPENLWPDATFGKVRYVRDTGESLHRRSLYTFWRRISMPPMFFDNAKREVCTVNPSRTNTPLHALATLNDTTNNEAARLLAAPAVLAAGDFQLGQAGGEVGFQDDRVALLFRDRVAADRDTVAFLKQQSGGLRCGRELVGREFRRQGGRFLGKGGQGEGEEEDGEPGLHFGISRAGIAGWIKRR